MSLVVSLQQAALLEAEGVNALVLRGFLAAYDSLQDTSLSLSGEMAGCPSQWKYRPAASHSLGCLLPAKPEK